MGTINCVWCGKHLYDGDRRIEGIQYCHDNPECRREGRALAEQDAYEQRREEAEMDDYMAYGGW